MHMISTMVVTNDNDDPDWNRNAHINNPNVIGIYPIQFYSCPDRGVL